MKVTLHHGLSKSEWFEKTIFEQMANVGSEVFRAIKWQKKNAEYSRLAFERGVELLNLTIEDDKNENRQRELFCLRELFTDYLSGNNSYHSTADFFEKYFYAFNYAARINT